MTTGSFTQLDEENPRRLAGAGLRIRLWWAGTSRPYALDRACFSAGQNAQYNMNIGEEKAPTLVAEGPAPLPRPRHIWCAGLRPASAAGCRDTRTGGARAFESPAPSIRKQIAGKRSSRNGARPWAERQKPKTRRQIIRWLQNPHTDSAEYKAYGNSIVAQCAFLFSRGSLGNGRR